jgi:hypothetical protein
VQIGDVTGDGLPDVVLTTSSRHGAPNNFTLFVFAQRPGGGHHVERLPTSGRYSDDMGLALGDADGDGDLDAAVATSDGVNLFRQSDGGLQPYELITTASAGAQHVAMANLDGAGPDEIVVAGADGLSALTADPAGGWTAESIVREIGTWELETGDVNGDSRPDVVAIDGGDVLLLTQGAEGFASRELDVPSSGIAVGDVTGDGREDVAATHLSGTRSAVNVFVQSPAGVVDEQIAYPAAGGPEPVEVADLNGDGRSDVIALHTGGAAGVFRQLETGLLAPERLFPLPYSSYQPTGLALGDVSSDGRPDIAIADPNYGLTLLVQADPPAEEPPPVEEPPVEEQPPPDDGGDPVGDPGGDATAGAHSAKGTAAITPPPSGTPAAQPAPPAAAARASAAPCAARSPPAPPPVCG